MERGLLSVLFESQNEHEPPKIEIYDRLEQDKNARIIRNLCIIRTAIQLLMRSEISRLISIMWWQSFVLDFLIKLIPSFESCSKSMYHPHRH